GRLGREDHRASHFPAELSKPRNRRVADAVDPISANASPVLRRAIASAIWNAESLGFLPNLTLRACARFRPSSVRARINSPSNSARPPSRVSINRPWAVVVSAPASASDLKPASALATRSRMLSRSRGLHARRSSLVTSSTSSGRDFRPLLRHSIGLGDLL